MANVLLTGVYLADQENTAGLITSEFEATSRHSLTTRWLALSPEGAGRTDLLGTVEVLPVREMKCVLLNRLLRGTTSFDWVIICDDDVEVEPGFLDKFLTIAERFDFSICQPARTLDSYTDHAFVAQMPGLIARQTRFVEIGPIVFLRRDAAKLLLPFPPTSAMGWGLDFVWPVKIEAAGLRLGIIDGVPVAHRIRPPASLYRYDLASEEMANTLSRNRHLRPEQAFTIVEAWSE